MSKRQTIINMINDKELISYLYENNKSDNLRQAITSRKKKFKKKISYMLQFLEFRGRVKVLFLML